MNHLPIESRQAPRQVPGRTAGFSLIELFVSAGILLIMVYAVTTLSISGKDSQEYASRMNRATEINQVIMDDLRLELVSAVQVFGDDASGQAHFDRFDLSAYPPLMTSMRLPSPRAAELIEPDTALSEKTGNTLFYARQAWVDEYECTSGELYRLDVYRWVVFYLTPEDGGPQPGRPVGLNLVQVISEPLADGAQVDKITDPTDQAEVLRHLANGTPGLDGVSRTPVNVVWARGSDVSAVGTFRQIAPFSGSLSDTPFPGRPDPWEVLPDESQTRSNLLSYRHHSVATNYARTAMGVGRYGLIDLTDDGFPHGFEVQLVGPSVARQVMVRLVIASTNNRGHRAWSELTSLVDVRDL